MNDIFEPLLTYIGTKLIRAKRMTRLAYNQLRGWELPADENGADEGYLVEYLDGGKPNLVGFQGYVSWSPRDVFERAYQSTDGMDFGLAVNALKLGKRVAREGWNGKGMFIYFVGEAKYPASQNPMGTMVGIFPDDKVPYRSYIAMKTAQNDVVPWVASQTDILATDWHIVE